MVIEYIRALEHIARTTKIVPGRLQSRLPAADLSSPSNLPKSIRDQPAQVFESRGPTASPALRGI